MEEHALRTLEDLFHEYAVQPSDLPDLYSNRSRVIVNALKRKYPYETDFRLAFWKILWNLKLKGPSAADTMKDLFNGRWKTADDFVSATDDELDEKSAEFRRNVRNAVFNRLQSTQKFISAITEKEDEGCNKDRQVVAEERAEGLICNRCRSANTEYLLLQTSRGDEGSTARVLCNNCGNRWKFR